MSLQLKDLKESTDFLNYLFDNITSAVFIVDENIRIQNINNSFNVLFQKQEDKLIGELCGNAIGCSFAVDQNKDCGTTSNCDKCVLRDSLLKSFSQEVPVYRKILVRDFYIKEERINKYFQFSTKYISFSGQKMVMIIVDDLTELEEQRRSIEDKNLKLENLNNEMVRFLGIAAHDLRNPIGAIRGFTELMTMAGSNYSDEEKEEFLKLIYDASDFSLNLLNDLLDVSKIEAGKLELNIQNSDFRKLLINSVDLHEYFARNKKIRLRTEIPEKLSHLNIDQDKISQLLNNLIMNAIKFTAEGKEITIKAESCHEGVCCHIIDQGPGIPEEEINNIFEAFKQSSIKATAGEKGSGLGLAIAKKIIEAHGGSIGINSEPGKGSDFYFKLPG